MTCSLKVLFMGENEHRYVCSICSIHICLYGLFRVIRSWSGGCEGTGVRVRLVGCNVSVRGLNIEDIPAQTLEMLGADRKEVSYRDKSCHYNTLSIEINWPCFPCWNRESLSFDFQVFVHIFHLNGHLLSVPCLPIWSMLIVPGVCVHMCAGSEGYGQASPATSDLTICVFECTLKIREPKRNSMLKETKKAKNRISQCWVFCRSRGDTAHLETRTADPVCAMAMQPLPAARWAVGDARAEIESKKAEAKASASCEESVRGKEVSAHQKKLLSTISAICSCYRSWCVNLPVCYTGSIEVTQFCLHGRNILTIMVSHPSAHSGTIPGQWNFWMKEAHMNRPDSVFAFCSSHAIWLHFPTFVTNQNSVLAWGLQLI